jgi:15-cis-phytoene desaturase
MKTYDTIIVGAGLAGLACALDLTEAGQKVLVLETQKNLGGRTSNWDEDGMPVESALHKFLGFYSELPRLIKRVGGDLGDVIEWTDEMEIVMPDGGPRALFGASLFGKPLETISSALGNGDFLSLEDKASFVKVMGIALAEYYASPEKLDEITVMDFAKKHGATEAVIERLLRPFTEALLFYPVEECSTLALASLIGPYAHKSVKFGIGTFKGGMADLMINPIAEGIKRQGGEIQSGSPVEKLLVEEGCVVGVVRDGKEIRARQVVVATSLGQIKPLLEASLPDNRWAKDILSIPTLDGIGLQIDLDRPSWPADRVVFAPGTHISVFAEQSRTTFKGTKGRLSIDISPTSDIEGLSDEEIYELAMKDCERIGMDIAPHCQRYRVTRHPGDFHRPGIGVDKLRPDQETPVVGLVLAGDYTKQPTPFTMEGAVISGQLAAKVVLKAG